MSAPELVLHDFPARTNVAGWSSFSPFVMLVERALNLTGLPYRQVGVDMMKLKKLNPVGQLPVLGIGTELVADSTRILLRLEELAPGSMSGGLDARMTAEAWLWEEFADTALYPYVLAARWMDERGWPTVRAAFFGPLPQPIRSIASSMIRRSTRQMLLGRDFLRGGLDACYARLARVLEQLDTRAPEAGFWLGERPSAADLGLFAQLHALRMPAFPHTVALLAPYARLARWLDRVDAATRKA